MQSGNGDSAMILIWVIGSMVATLAIIATVLFSRFL